LGSSALTELDQQAPLWANTKRPPRRARGKKRRFDDCHPCYSYSDENDDDDEEPVSCKQERSSETMEPMHPKFVKFGSAHRLSTHITNLHLAFNTASFHQSDCRPYKRSAPRDKNMTSSAQSATFKVRLFTPLHGNFVSELTPQSRHTSPLRPAQTKH
jgi:hypothetical protein